MSDHDPTRQHATLFAKSELPPGWRDVRGAYTRRSTAAELGQELKSITDFRPKTPLGLPMKLSTEGARLREIVREAEEKGKSKSSVFHKRDMPLEAITDSQEKEAIRIFRKFMGYYQEVQGKIKRIDMLDRDLTASENKKLEQFNREAEQVKQVLIELGAYDEMSFPEAARPPAASEMSSPEAARVGADGWVDGQERSPPVMRPDGGQMVHLGYNPVSGNLYGGSRKKKRKSKKRKSKKRKSRRGRRTHRTRRIRRS